MIRRKTDDTTPSYERRKWLLYQTHKTSLSAVSKMPPNAHILPCTREPTIKHFKIISPKATRHTKGHTHAQQIAASSLPTYILFYECYAKRGNCLPTSLDDQDPEQSSNIVPPTLSTSTPICHKTLQLHKNKETNEPTQTNNPNMIHKTKRQTNPLKLQR